MSRPQPPRQSRRALKANAPPHVITGVLEHADGPVLTLRTRAGKIARVVDSDAVRTKQIGVLPPAIFRIVKVPVGEVVGFDDAMHDLLCLRDDVGGGKEPQFPNKRVKADKLCGIVQLMSQGICQRSCSFIDELSKKMFLASHCLGQALSLRLRVM